MLVDQHLLAGRDHRAAPPSDGRTMVQHGLFEHAHDLRVGAQVFELRANVDPFRFELLDGIQGVV